MSEVTAGQEMSLKQVVEHLPDGHKARLEYLRLEQKSVLLIKAIDALRKWERWYVGQGQYAGQTSDAAYAGVQVLKEYEAALAEGEKP